MALKVIWRRRAIEDVGRIVDYIGQFNPYAAAGMAGKLQSAAVSLRLFPLRGRIGDEPGTRELSIVPPYVIIYRAADDGAVEILRIWHAAQSRREDE